MDIRIISDDTQRKTITRCILEALPEWFELPQGREEYIRSSTGKPFFCAYDGKKPVGFLYLRQTGKDTAELAVIGVLKSYHRSGIGRRLFEKAKEYARGAGYSFLQVKTVEFGAYEEYDKTNLFYLSLGFKELEVFPEYWDKENPCQIYIMALK